MTENRNQKIALRFEEYLTNNDLESIKNELPKLLKSFLKIDSRMDRILNQSDNQQHEMLRLKENIEERGERISTLLNNAGQGFLYFDKDMIVGAEYSKEVLRIFDQDITNKDITTLLYPDDENYALFFKTTLQSILSSIPMKQEILISLLKNEFFINDAYIQVEYKVLNEENFMMILTDITSKKKLSQQIKDEQQILKMVVETVTSLEQFLSIKNDYDTFISNIEDFKSLDKLSDLRKEIHTYKGLFAQKEMLNIVKELHDFETYIDISLKVDNIEDTLLNITAQDMEDWLEKDIKVLKDILGEDIFESSSNISIDKNRIDSLYTKVEQYLETKELENLITLHKDLVQLTYPDISVVVKPYEKLVSQLALRLEKDIKPLIITTDKIFIPDKYKPFLNSLVHVFRNSVDHGIEDIERRIELEKEYDGKITCDIKLLNSNIVIKISDDGAGIDEEKIKSLAIDKIYIQKMK